MPILGPNTDLDSAHLRPNVILCAGEDSEDLVESLKAARSERVIPQSIRFRSYEFWVFPDFLFIQSGIGTGCIEPLLHEILGAGTIRQIILIGTAGLLESSTKLRIEQTYLVRNALPWHTGIDRLCSGLVTASWEPVNSIEECVSLSTDLYYASGTPGKEIIARFGSDSKRVLIEMEVAQFYYFCGRFSGQVEDGLRFAAIKGASNALGDGQAQLDRGRMVLARTLGVAMGMMGIGAE